MLLLIKLWIANVNSLVGSVTQENMTDPIVFHPFGIYDGTWFVYILRCGDGSLYTGITNHLRDRIHNHINSKGAKYTRGRGPFSLVWSRACETETIARKEEARIKKLSKSQKEAMLTWASTNPKLVKFNELLRIYLEICPPPPENISEFDILHLNAMSSLGTFDIDRICSLFGINKEVFIHMKEVPNFMNILTPMYIRDYAVNQFAWAVPTEEAIQKTISFGPLVEMGAGTGYWGKAIEICGGDVICFDRFPPPDGFNVWHSNGKLYREVLKGFPKQLKDFPDRTLFLCWPPHGDDMAIECLQYWKGRYLIHIGEIGGCTANDEFYTKLEEEFECIDQLLIPQWPGIRDSLTVWKRND